MDLVGGWGWGFLINSGRTPKPFSSRVSASVRMCLHSHNLKDNSPGQAKIQLFTQVYPWEDKFVLRQRPKQFKLIEIVSVSGYTSEAIQAV